MTTQQAHLLVEQLDDITVVGFAEVHLREELQLREISQELQQLVDRTQRPKILIHFDDVEHLSSEAMGILVELHHRTRRKGGQLHLANIGPQILPAFEVTGFSRTFHIHNSADAALRSFA